MPAKRPVGIRSDGLRPTGLANQPEPGRLARTMRRLAVATVAGALATAVLLPTNHSHAAATPNPSDSSTPAATYAATPEPSGQSTDTTELQSSEPEPTGNEQPTDNTEPAGQEDPTATQAPDQTDDQTQASETPSGTPDPTVTAEPPASDTYANKTPQALVDVDKKVRGASCDQTACDLQYLVTVTNYGSTDIVDGDLTDTLSSQVFDVKAQTGSFAPPVTSVDMRGRYGGLAVTEDGKAWSWGDKSQPGLGDPNATGLVAGQIPNIAGQVVKVAAADRWGGFALTSQGQVWAWGEGNYGALGDGRTVVTDGSRNATTPQLVAGLPKDVVDIVGRNYGAYVITRNGEVYGWGENTGGALGDGATVSAKRIGRSTPGLVKGLPSGVAKVVLRGSNGAFALTRDGRVFTWGQGDVELGTGAASTVLGLSTALQIKVLDGKTVTDVVADGSNGGAALTNDGKVWAWGQGSNGRIGNGGTKAASYPVAVSLPAAITKIEPRAGYGFYALTKQGKVYVWGGGAYGSLGNGAASATSTMTTNASPSLVSLKDPASDVVARGQYGAYAIDANHQVWAWGYDDKGEMATGVVGSSAKPALVQGLPADLAGLVPGANFGTAYAMTGSGEVWGWGLPATLGIGLASGNPVAPTQVAGFEVTTFGDILSPASQNWMGGFVERRYQVPLLEAGKKLQVLLTGRVARSSADFRVENQAWFTSPLTPRTVPDLPKDPGAKPDPNGIPNNKTCNTKVRDTVAPKDSQLDFNVADPTTWHFADACDQVPYEVKALPSGVKLGSLSGLVWVDENGDGERQASETARAADVPVDLLRGGQLAGQTVTGPDGTYQFTSLPEGTDYVVRFGAQGRPAAGQAGGFYTFTVPSGLPLQAGRSYADPATGETPEVAVKGGAQTEPVDAGLVVLTAGLDLLKTANPASGSRVEPGDDITYTVTGTNTGKTALDPVVVDDDLTGVLAHADLVQANGPGVAAPSARVVGPAADQREDASGGLTWALTPGAEKLAWTGKLAEGQHVELVYTVQLTSTAPGGWVLKNAATASAQPILASGSNGGGKLPSLKVQSSATGHVVTTPFFILELGDNGPLTGATWRILDDDGGKPGKATPVAHFSQVPNPLGGQMPGLWRVSGLIAGQYWLEETKAPQGFDLLAAPVAFVIDQNGGVAVNDATSQTVASVASGQAGQVTAGRFVLQVKSTASLALPQAGGPGLNLVWLGGGLLAGLAGLLTLASRCRSGRARPVRPPGT